jgi:DNA-binding NtrC family response regulator
LLYLSRAPDQHLQDLLRLRGWSISCAQTLRDAQRVLSHEPVTVGLFDFSSGYTLQQLAAFEVIFASPSVGWVTTVSEQQLGQPIVRRLIRLYFFDFAAVPCAPRRIVASIDHAYGMNMLEHSETRVTPPDDTEMIGSCEAMQALFRSIRKVAHTDAPVLVYGESGTGKELTAAAIHRNSFRSKGPFGVINCGAIPHALLQSELFGHERGAFTGAQQRKIGHVEAAHGGTLFLDEIGDLPLESQVSFLRFLQERKVQRLGSHEAIPVDVRVISATHVNLEDAVRAGTFRADLYHRLCVLRLVEPPLRARGKDIELLAHHTLERYRAESPRRIRGFSAAAIKAMYNYHWPGNIRELINRVRRAIVMTESRVITPADLELEHCLHGRSCTLEDARESAERHAIEDALLRHCNRLNQVAQDLGVSRATLYRLLQAHGLRERTQAAAGVRHTGLPPAADRGGEAPADGARGRQLDSPRKPRRYPASPTHSEPTANLR